MKLKLRNNLRNKLRLIGILCILWGFGNIYCVSLAEEASAESAEAVSVTMRIEYEDIVSDGFDTLGEYAIICGLDADGAVVWEQRTQTYPCAQASYFTEIGMYEGAFYYCEQGNINVENIADGSLRWSAATGSVCGYDFGPDGTLYYCGYWGPDFGAVDKNGNVLQSIRTMDEDYYWAYKVEYLGDEVAVTFEGYPEGGNEDTVFLVNLQDYSFHMQNLEDADLFADFLAQGYYAEEVEGTPLYYSEYDVDMDSLPELIVYTYDENGTKRYYIWFQDCDTPVCLEVDDELGGWIPVLYHSPSYNALAAYSRNIMEESYWFYDFSYDKQLNIQFCLYRTRSEDGLKMIFFDDGSFSNPQKLVQYYEYEDEEHKATALAVWEGYEDTLTQIQFQRLQGF